jgi:two-component system cell cycle sensor histidine kinase/response regulator CckA
VTVALSPPTEEQVETLRAERDALAQRLRESEARLRLLWDNSPIPVSVTSVAEARYLYVNRAHCEYYGRPPEYYYGIDPYQAWIEVTSPEDFEKERVLFQRIADGEIETYSIEKTFRLPSGGQARGELTLSATRDAQGRLHELIGVTRDLRAQRAAEDAARSLEEQLRRSQKLEVVGRMAGGVAHDFNNRLLIVMGYAELLHAELSDARLREFVDQITTSAERSAELTKQLLAFSRRQVLSPKSVDVDQVLSSMRRMIESLLSEKIELALVGGATEHLYCDPGQLEQVVLNLAINARDAMPNGGRLTLATRDVLPGAPELSAELSQSRFVALDVSDTGAGIAPEVLPHIFEPFFTTKPLGAGTGLGLSTVDGIVRQSGGCVLVSTRPGAGTTVSVLLPVSGGVAEASAAPLTLDIEARPGRVGTVLICDDDDAVRKLLGDVLAIGGYRILLARDGEQARSLAAGVTKLDLLVTDIIMPRTSGAQLAAEVRAEHPDVLVLFVSGCVDPDALESIAGEEFLAKPFLPAALLKRVRQIVDAREAPSESSVRVPRA